jgi:hypothetical protein
VDRDPPFLRGGNLRRSLGTTLDALLARLPADALSALAETVAAEAFARGLIYEDDDGVPQPTPVLLRPRVLGGNQRAYLHHVSRVLEGAYGRLFRLWLTEPEVREILPVGEGEARWLSELAHPGQDAVFFGRFDASTDFASPDWVRQTRFFEFNPVGAGGTYLAPTVDDVIMRHVVPVLRQFVPTLVVETNDDPRKVLLEVLADQARALSLRRFNVALCQWKHLVGGIVEFPANVEYLRSLGIACWHVDPAELRLRGDELFFGDTPIDLIYRDHEVSDFAAAEAAGADLRAMRHALRTGRVVSSLAGELDHKSAFEVFTTPAFASAFTTEERRVFQRHVPWTRRIRAARTTDPDGALVDLPAFVEAARADCVLKPNRAFGGEGILIGPQVDDAAWRAGIERALAAPGEWVVQAYSPVAEKGFLCRDGEGGWVSEELYSVLGLFPSTQRLGILGRASRLRVVNVTQRGGLLSVLRLL